MCESLTQAAMFINHDRYVQQCGADQIKLSDDFISHSVFTRLTMFWLTDYYFIRYHINQYVDYLMFIEFIVRTKYYNMR